MRFGVALAVALAGVPILGCQDAPTSIDPDLAQGGSPGKPGGAGGVASVEIAPATAEIVVGATVQLTAVAKDRKGNVVTDVAFTWSSSDPGTASVDAVTGLVTGVAAGGPVTITASTGGRKAKTGTVLVTVVSPNYALDFDQDYVVVPDGPDLDLSDEWTIEAWIKPRSLAHQHLLSKWGGCSTASYSMVLGYAEGEFGSGIASCTYGTQSVISSAVIVADQWQHVAVTLGGGTLRLYRNGVQLAEKTESLAPVNTTTSLWFGQHTDGGYPFNGVMDEVRIWKVVRTPAELAGAMNARLIGNESGLVAYWSFDEGNGDIAFDVTGRGNNGRFGNAIGTDANDPHWTTDKPF